MAAVACYAAPHTRSSGGRVAHAKTIKDVFAASQIHEVHQVHGAEKKWQAFSSKAVAIDTQRPKPTPTEITKDTCSETAKHKGQALTKL